jgi:hypothetical protein
MATEVIVTADFETWWDGLDVEEQKSVAVVVAMLEERGATLPFPYSSGIAGSRKLRELRIQHAGEPYRVLYAFDPKRNAILLLGGNKTGVGHWYDTYVPKAEKLFAAYLKESRQADYSIFTSGAYRATAPDAAFPQEKPHFATPSCSE